MFIKACNAIKRISLCSVRPRLARKGKIYNKNVMQVFTKILSVSFNVNIKKVFELVFHWISPVIVIL